MAKRSHDPVVELLGKLGLGFPDDMVVLASVEVNILQVIFANTPDHR